MITLQLSYVTTPTLLPKFFILSSLLNTSFPSSSNISFLFPLTDKVLCPYSSTRHLRGAVHTLVCKVMGSVGGAACPWRNYRRLVNFTRRRQKLFLCPELTLGAGITSTVYQVVSCQWTEKRAVAVAGEQIGVWALLVVACRCNQVAIDLRWVSACSNTILD